MPASENGSRVNSPSACLTLAGPDPGEMSRSAALVPPHCIPLPPTDFRSNAGLDARSALRVAKLKDLLTTVEESCSIEAGSAEIGIVSGGRSRYAVPGIGGRPGVDARAVTRRAAVP